MQYLHSLNIEVFMSFAFIVIKNFMSTTGWEGLMAHVRHVKKFLKSLQPTHALLLLKKIPFFKFEEKH